MVTIVLCGCLGKHEAGFNQLFEATIDMKTVDFI